MRIREGPALVLGAALVAALLSLLLLRAWVAPAVLPRAPERRVTVVPAASPSSPVRPTASPSPSPSPAASPSPSPTLLPSSPSPTPPARPPRTVLTPTPEAAPPVEVPTAPEPEAEPVELPLGSPSPQASPSPEEGPDEGPLAVDARIDRWPADGPDPAVRVRLVLANPGAAPATVEHAEVVYSDASGQLGMDRQDVGSVPAGDSRETWFYYGNSGRFMDVRARLRLVYRVGSETFVIEREMR